MNLFNLLPSNAAADLALMTPAELAELEAWFSERDTEEYAWERLADLVDIGAL
jgi:hypothetical protein